MVWTNGTGVSSFFTVNHISGKQFRYQPAQARSAAGGDLTVLSSELALGLGRKDDKSSLVHPENEIIHYRVDSKTSNEGSSVPSGLDKLECLWDDGYGTAAIEDYFEASKEIIKSDGGPPRWFSPVCCGHPLKGSPLLLFLPGMDGTGMGLILHHKALGKAFEVRCLHIPIQDRTPFEGLVDLVEQTLRFEHSLSHDKPIYLVGDSFGGCLALAVAARNPSIDLVLVLVNPATSFASSPLQPLFPLLEAMSNEMHFAIPYALSFIMGNPVKMAMVKIESLHPPLYKIEQLSQTLTSLLPSLSIMTDILPRDALVWKLKLLKSACAYANSRLHAVKAEVLVLASGKDHMLPSADEAQRLKSSLQNCVIRHFKENGHTLLLEDGMNLFTVIKGTCKYRRSRRWDSVTDFIPPSIGELHSVHNEVIGWYQSLIGSVMLSTLEDGTVVRGLAGIPDEGPVLLVGNHMLMGLELFGLVDAFLREKNIIVRGITHPMLFGENSTTEFSLFDWVKVFGAVPVAPTNLYKLLSTNAHVLLYPGGAREALHKKGEEYKLFWPDQQEFVRMAAKFGAKIVPFGVVGEDDIAQLVFDYNDLIKVPIVNDYIRDTAQKTIRVRDKNMGEVANEEVCLPVAFPKLPGRFYFLFGKPIDTKGKKEILKDKALANQLYLQTKSQVERHLSYLIKKREEDPYRNVIDRKLYQAFTAAKEIPSFQP